MWPFLSQTCRHFKTGSECPNSVVKLRSNDNFVVTLGSIDDACSVIDCSSDDLADAAVEVAVAVTASAASSDPTEAR